MTWDGKTVSQFEKEADLANKACQSIFTDSQGRVWLGLLTAGAAAVTSPGSFVSLAPAKDSREGLCSRSLRTGAAESG